MAIRCSRCKHVNDVDAQSSGPVALCAKCGYPLYPEEVGVTNSAGPIVRDHTPAPDTRAFGAGFEAAPPGTADAAWEAFQPARPSASLWFIYLLFRPRSFFTHFALNRQPLLNCVRNICPF